MTAVSWLLVALALVLAGPPRAAPSGPGVPSRRPSLRTLQLAAAASALLAGVGVAGPVAGSLAGAVLAAAVYLGVARLHARPPRVHADHALALCLDLVAVALRAGQPLPAALVLAAPAGAAAGAPLLQVAGLLRLGAAPAQAWAVLDGHPVLEQVAAAARRSADSGIRLAGAFEQRADEVRAELTAAAQARARRVEVLVAAPLGLCFLPAFVCVGIVPTVIGIAGSVLSS